MPWGAPLLTLSSTHLAILMREAVRSHKVRPRMSRSAMLVWATKKPAERRARWERNQIGKLSGPVSTRRNGRQAEEMVRGTG
jgi:hypothetical protein